MLNKISFSPKIQHHLHCYRCYSVASLGDDVKIGHEDNDNEVDDNDFDDDEDQHLCVGDDDEVDDKKSDDVDVNHLCVGEAAHLPLLALLLHLAHRLAPGHHRHVLDHRYDVVRNHKHDCHDKYFGDHHRS